IKSKIHEMIMDTVVLPNMENLPFFSSFGMGGVYEGDVKINDDGKKCYDNVDATDNEHIKHEIINSNTSMDNDSTAEGSNDSCSGESNLTKSNNYGFGYVTKHLNGLI
ncbi:10937_t:CDS:2, partial [Entrophospora sp. SA101]